MSWDMLSMVMLLYDLLFFPFEIAFSPARSIIFDVLDWSVACFWTFDILVTFFTGYHDSGLVEMHPQRIARHYVGSWFLLDAMIVISDWLVVVLTISGVNVVGLGRLTKTGRSSRALKALKFLRLVRTGKLSSLMSSIFVWVTEEKLRSACNILFLLVFIAIINHYVSCGWYLLGSQESGDHSWVDFFEADVNRTLFYTYTTSLHWSLTQFTPASMEITPKNGAERVYAVCTLLFAMVVFSSFVSSITSSMTQIRQHQSEMEQSQRELRAFFSHKKVSVELCQRIWMHLRQSQWSSRKTMHENQLKILARLPDSLKSKLRDELFSPILTKAPVIQWISNGNVHGMSALCSQAVTEVTVVSKEELFVAGMVAKKLFFLYLGRMKYARIKDLENLESGEVLFEGQWVCEPALWMDWLHCGTLSTEYPCELLELDCQCFRRIMQTHGRSLSFLSRYARLFHETMSHTDDWATDLWNNADQLEGLVAEAAHETRKDTKFKTAFNFGTVGNIVKHMRTSNSSVAI